MDIKLRKLNENSIIPTRGSPSSAGYDLYADKSKPYYVIYPGQTEMIPTGIATEIPSSEHEGWFGAIFARSGLASKRGLRPANCVGVIDPDYRGEIKVALHNDSEKVQIIEGGDRIAQIVFMPYAAPTIEVVEELSDTERGDGGFGSTGTNHNPQPEYEQLSLFDMMD